MSLPVSVRSLLALSRTRPPPILSRFRPVTQNLPHFRCQLKLIPTPLLRRNVASTRCVQYARPSPVIKSDPESKKQTDVATEPRERSTLRENIYTLPNLLTASRILACPVLGWSILHDDFHLATGLLVYAGLSDLVSNTFSSFVDTTMVSNSWKKNKKTMTMTMTIIMT